MIFYVLIFLLALLSILLWIKLYRVNRRIKNINQFLILVKSGNKSKLFPKGKGTLTELSYLLNETISNYELELEKISKKEQLQNDLLTNLSHDVRTPLTSLLGYLDAIDQKVIDGDELTNYTRIAKNKAYELNNYVDTLFEWIKIKSQEHPYSFEKIDIHELTREILVDWIPIFEKEHVTLEPILGDDELFINVDQKAYKRIINNLIQNALLHGRCNYLKIETKREQDKLFILIEDNGKGIPIQKIDYIFERFYKCDDARTAKSSGLGLAIVKELVMAHRGQIGVTSVEHQKTVFTIELPLN